MTPNDARVKAKAIAVTGGPSSRPTRVALPTDWDAAAQPSKTPQFPHLSPGSTRGSEISGGSRHLFVEMIDAARKEPALD
jgi:hypothetical protein